ncbi:MAG: tyrosine-type recombinase/integrase [Methylobacterium sp.]|uniref:tyrosine-type recombinase/integrase n=1 Tax=Methylobacterium sp. TaxID=409 RepID=UPI002587769D|nr:tyrosine-type recombinase/integrase [Methylobacterium sp.]MBY0297457.1 tyrosine-type recombinase/integrase [Methylobacterium sp.]
MGTIVERPRKDGSTGYHAQIVVKRDGRVHRETKTFDRRPAAAAWIKKRERELEQPGAVLAPKVREPSLADAIDRYVGESRRALGRTKAQVLRAIKAFDIAAKPCSEIGSAEIVAFARELARGRQPQTVSNYLAHLSAVFTIAKPAWGYPLDPAQMEAAQQVARRLGLTAKSKGRERRPTLAELDLLMTHFGEVRRRRPSSLPMQAVIAFAIFSTRRQEEITRIAWADLDEGGSRVMVRDMKNPGEKIGNDVWCELPPEALAIALAQPRSDDRIFPYSVDAISAAFTRACAFLAIEDLHFHDLRHDGVSRLFEMGRTVPLAASVSGHRSWQSLQRYTHVRQIGDKYAGWPWRSVLGNQNMS